MLANVSYNTLKFQENDYEKIDDDFMLHVCVTYGLR